jgi:hypothetical protein
MVKNDLKAAGIFEKMYTDISARIAKLCLPSGERVIKTIDLWNNQWANLATEKPFLFPCIFIEFMPIQWRSVGGGVQVTDAVITLHIGSKTNASSRDGNSEQSTYLKHLRAIDAVHALVTGWGTETGYMGSFTRIGSTQDHDHDDIIAHLEVYRVTVKDFSAQRPMLKLDGDKLVVEME